MRVTLPTTAGSFSIFAIAALTFFSIARWVSITMSTRLWPSSGSFCTMASIDIFESALKVPLIIVPIANHDDNQHAKDENLRVQNLFDGIEVFAALMTRLGPAWGGVVP